MWRLTLVALVLCGGCSSSGPDEAESAVATPTDPYEPAVGRIEAGTDVYYRESEGQEASLWFRVLEPEVTGSDGTVQMKVQYPSGRTEYIDRHKVMRSQAAVDGQLVIRR